MWRFETWTAALAGCLIAAPALAQEPAPIRKEPRSELVIHKVGREKLSLDIYERGALESADNREIVCRVKTGAKGIAILWVIDDGSFVKQGQLLARLDDSALREQRDAQKVVSERAKAALTVAEENVKIIASTNESEAKTAGVSLELAELDLKKYLEGDHPALVEDLRGRRQLAEADLEEARKSAEAADGLFKNGTITPEQAGTRRLQLINAKVILDKAKQDERVLLQFTHPRSRKDYESKLDEAKRFVELVNRKSKATATLAESERAAKLAALKQEEARLKEMDEDIGRCQIVAPHDGIAVYYVAETNRFAAQQPIIAQGEQIREGQKLMRMPDLSKMEVQLRITEAVIRRVKVGQEAQVRIDAFPGRVLRGKVRQVAAVPVQGDWPSVNQKVYPARITLEGEVKGLKPGMSADVTLVSGKETEPVLAVPALAILPPTPAGQRLCVVRTRTGLEQYEVEVGRGNGKMTEIVKGLKEGDEVVLNPRSLYVERPDRRWP